MLSQTVEYALRAMVYLGSLDGDAVNCQTVAERTGVPQGYLSKIMRDLVLADLVRSFRGPRGGFTLARPPVAITLLDVVNAVDPIHRLRPESSDHPLFGALRPLHQRIDDAMAQIEQTLRATTLGTALLIPPRATPTRSGS